MSPNALTLFTNRLERFPDVAAPIVYGGWLRPSVFQSYTNELANVCALAARADEFFTQVQIANGFPDPLRLNFRTDGHLTAELAARPSAEALTLLNESLASLSKELKEAIIRLCERLKSAMRIGVIDFKSKDVCRLCYFRGRQQTTSTVQGSNVNHVRTVYHAGYVEDLVDVSISRWPGYWVKKPQWAKELLYKCPDFLQPGTTIVDGNVIREIKLEQATVAERWTEYVPPPVYHYDPAIVLGNYYVLAGWSKSEC